MTCLHTQKDTRGMISYQRDSDLAREEKQDNSSHDGASSFPEPHEFKRPNVSLKYKLLRDITSITTDMLIVRTSKKAAAIAFEKNQKTS